MDRAFEKTKDEIWSIHFPITIEITSDSFICRSGCCIHIVSLDIYSHRWCNITSYDGVEDDIFFIFLSGCKQNNDTTIRNMVFININGCSIPKMEYIFGNISIYVFYSAPHLFSAIFGEKLMSFELNRNISLAEGHRNRVATRNGKSLEISLSKVGGGIRSLWWLIDVAYFYR